MGPSNNLLRKNKLLAFLSHPAWQGAGVIIGILIGVIGFYISQQQPFWLYIAASIITFFISFAAYDRAEQQQVGWYIVALVFIILIAIGAGLLRGSEIATATLQPTIQTLQMTVTQQQSTIEAIPTSVTIAEARGADVARAELQPTIEAIPTSVTIAEARGIDAARAELQPTIEALRSAKDARRASENEDISISANTYPFIPAKTSINEGDIVEISVLGSDTTWYCIDDDPIDPDGRMSYPERQQNMLSPSANFCGLIGRIDNGPYLLVGTTSRFVADASGYLYLGANDAPPEKCGHTNTRMCFLDNRGSLTVRITVTRKAT